MKEKILLTFLNAPKESLKSNSLRTFSLIGVPTERGCVFRAGTALAPESIRKASIMYYYPNFDGLYDPERQKYILTDNSINDLGDVNDIPRFSLNERITKMIRFIRQKGSIPITLGGDHSITYPILQAYEQPFDVIHLDAHSDYQRYDETGVTECGVVMRKVRELSHVNRIIHAGIRGYLNSGQGIRDSIKDGNIVIPCDILKQQGPEVILKHLGDIPIYITFDSDILDPSICPGTTVPEPGGIDYLLAKDILIELTQRGNLIGADFVELNPIYDPSQISSFHLTKLILDMIGEIKN